MGSYFVGIDTSCYTTSLAVVDMNGNLVGDYRKLLEVEEGKIGLRQSDGYFKHGANLPTLLEKLVSDIDPKEITAIGVSSQPRWITDSYMPVFTAGYQFASTVALSLSKKLYTFSHQEGHIEASKWSAQFESNKFMAVHLSGGTSEILLVELEGTRYKTQILGGTNDISAGKLIDRVGVYMGESFPSGKAMDSKISFKPEKKYNFPVSVKGSTINFSGLENYSKKLFDQNQSMISVSEGLFEAIAKSLLKAVNDGITKQQVNSVLFAGGVASSEYIKSYLTYHSYKNNTFIFCNPRYAVDNAVGIAQMCRKSFQAR